MSKIFVPKLLTVLREGYTRNQFVADMKAGIIVGIVAVPLCIAFAIASGVSPDKGLITAVVAGMVISLLGGSRVQISGPTGALVVVVYGVVRQYGVDGLIIVTFMSGIFLILLGFMRMGAVIKFIPQPLTVGFTSGIAVLIFTLQLKDSMGLDVERVPVDFVAKWHTYIMNIGTINPWAVLISLSTIAIMILFKRMNSRIPGSLVAIFATTLLVHLIDLPVHTIESMFGEFPSSIPMPHVPHLSFEVIANLMAPALVIAVLAAIISLLSAVVADGMTGFSHRSNMELIAQGAGNVFSSFFGGIPATGAIARTVTNVKNGGRTPLAGVIHAVVLLVVILFAGRWAKLIPLASLGGILVIVAYNMCEWRTFYSIVRGPRGDVLVLVTTFVLTVAVSLTTALEVGMIMAAFLFMHRMSTITNISIIEPHEVDDDDDSGVIDTTPGLPQGLLIYEINGPLFFGAAHKFKDALYETKSMPKVLIFRMRNVSTIDATGMYYFKEMVKEFQKKNVKIILSGVKPDIFQRLKDSRMVFMVGRRNVFDNYCEALKYAREELDKCAHTHMK